MTDFRAAALGAGLLLALGACATRPADVQAPPATYAAVDAPFDASASHEMVEAEILWYGEVTALSVAERQVTVRGQDGQSRVVAVDEDVAHLDQLQVGDEVEVFYHRSMVFDMQPAGSGAPGAWIWQDEDHAPEPDRPGMIEQEVVTVLSPVVAVDPVAHTLSVRSPDGQVDVLDVVRPEHRAALPQLAVGDMLRVQFRKLLTVRVVGSDD